MNDEPIRATRVNEVYSNDLVTVYDDEVQFPDGRHGTHVRVQSRGDGPGVVLLAGHAGKIALVKTFRYALGQWQWALPRGFSHGPDVLATARAELFEELGVRSSQLRILGHVTPDSGLLDARVAVVQAAVDDPTATPTDTSEVAEVRWLRTDELLAEIAGGRIEDGFTLSALCLARSVGALSRAQ